MQTETLLLNNMDCDACERLVTMTLIDLPGVHKVLANQRDVEVVFDEKQCTVEKLQKAIADIGHGV